jgi:hypothetical protein
LSKTFIRAAQTLPELTSEMPALKLPLTEVEKTVPLELPANSMPIPGFGALVAGKLPTGLMRKPVARTLVSEMVTRALPRISMP